MLDGDRVAGGNRQARERVADQDGVCAGLGASSYPLQRELRDANLLGGGQVGRRGRELSLACGLAPRRRLLRALVDQEHEHLDILARGDRLRKTPQERGPSRAWRRLHQHPLT